MQEVSPTLYLDIVQLDAEFRVPVRDALSLVAFFWAHSVLVEAHDRGPVCARWLPIVTSASSLSCFRMDLLIMSSLVKSRELPSEYFGCSWD